MIRETELNLFVPSPELLVRLASGERPLGVRAGPPRIKAIRETFFDTPDQTLRRRGMTCKLRQVEGEDPSVVVTVGEDPDAEGITSRLRLTAAAIGAGVYEMLRGDSEPAAQIQKFVDPGQLRPQVALDIQRLGRVFRGGLFLKPVLLLFFDRITVQIGGASSVFHEVSIRRRREGGPLIRDLARELRDQHHLFPDGLGRLQRAYRILAVEKKAPAPGFSAYGLNLALAVFQNGRLGLRQRERELHIPTFRGSGEDAARALISDLIGKEDLPLVRLGTTEPREGRAVVELWTIPELDLAPEALLGPSRLTWVPWHSLLQQAGRHDLRDPTLISTLLLLTRKKLLGQLPWVQDQIDTAPRTPSDAEPAFEETESSEPQPELRRVDALLPLLRNAENRELNLEIRLSYASQLSRELTRIFFQDVTRAKGRILSAGPDEDEEATVRLVDLISIKVRGIVDRLYRCVEDDLVSGLEDEGVHLRTWAGLMNADRSALLHHFTTAYLPSMQVAPEWGPSFIPDMPMAGCAVGILARFPGVDGPRFFHIVLRKDPPSFLPVPGTATVLPLEEVIRGYFLSQVRELEYAETYMFRFTTGAALVRESAPQTGTPLVQADRQGMDSERPDSQSSGMETQASPSLSEGGPGTLPLNAHPAVPGGSASHPHSSVEQAPDSAATDPPPAMPPPPPRYIESRQSVVVRVIVHQRMPESYQAQLLRALERQVSRRNPLIGWSDLYPVTGPLDLTGLDKLPALKEE